MSSDDSKGLKMQLPNAVLIPEIIRLLEEGHTVTLRLRGISMRPFLENDRDVALLTKSKETKVGDPVLAEVSPKHYVFHRVIAINGERVTLRGDGNLSEEHCLLKDVKAGAIGFYRKGRDTLDRTDERKWKAYSFLWTHLYPIRRYLLAIYRRLVLNEWGNASKKHEIKY